MALISFERKIKKTIMNNVLSITGIVNVTGVIFRKPKGMQKLYIINIIIQIKVCNPSKTFKATSTTVLHRLSFQML